MLALPQYRPFLPRWAGPLCFWLWARRGLWDFTLMDAARAVDFNVLLMMAGTMGTVSLFIESRMPARLAELLIVRVPNVKWAVCMLALFCRSHQRLCGQCCHGAHGSPCGPCHRPQAQDLPRARPHLHCGLLQPAGSCHPCGRHHQHPAGRLCGDELLPFLLDGGQARHLLRGGAGALASLGVLLFTFRHETQPISAAVETEVTDTVPSALMLLTVGLLIAASFLPQPAGGLPLALYGLRSGLICAGVCLFGILRACLRRRSFAPFRLAARELDCDTLLLLFGLFILIEGIRKAGVIDAAAQLFYTLSGDDPFRLYTLLVFVSVGLSAFIDNIPYVATMLPVVQGIAGLMNGGAGFPPELFYFGLLTGATLGGNLTPIGASANIAAIGILRKQGEQVRTRDFLRIGIPFTLAAVLTGYVYLWLVWGA